MGMRRSRGVVASNLLQLIFRPRIFEVGLHVDVVGHRGVVSLDCFVILIRLLRLSRLNEGLASGGSSLSF
jgi:hypothetical protein